MGYAMPGAIAHEKSRHHTIARAVPRKQVGKASVYSSTLQGRHMTDGERFDVHSSAAASKTLPIGTKAQVTDLKTGKSAEVTIKDRGPVPNGRVVDLTPHTASEIGLTRKEGIAPGRGGADQRPAGGCRLSERGRAPLTRIFNPGG